MPTYQAYIKCMSAWPCGYGLAPPEFLHHQSGGPGSNPGAGKVDQTDGPSGVGKSVAISRQMGEHC